MSVCAGAYHSGNVIMSWPERACASAAAVSISLSPCEVTKSIWSSTFSLSAHALQSLVMASLAPGTQWSQKATLSLPAACAPRTKGAAANAVVAIAAVPSTRRRVIVFSAILPFLEAGTLLGAARAVVDEKGRIMVVMVHNDDIPDGWEREGEEKEYFLNFSPDAYSVGIDILLYGLTH